MAALPETAFHRRAFGAVAPVSQLVVNAILTKEKARSTNYQKVNMTIHQTRPKRVYEIRLTTRQARNQLGFAVDSVPRCLIESVYFSFFNSAFRREIFQVFTEYLFRLLQNLIQSAGGMEPCWYRTGNGITLLPGSRHFNGSLFDPDSLRQA